jgi:hypothetical protein
MRMNLKTEETCSSQVVFKNQCWNTAWKFRKRFLMFISHNADLLHWACVLFCLIVEEFFRVLRIKGRTTKCRSFVAISHNYQLLCAHPLPANVNARFRQFRLPPRFGRFPTHQPGPRLYAERFSICNRPMLVYDLRTWTIIMPGN